MILAFQTGFCEDKYITKAEEITYDWLINTGAATGYTDHIPHFREIFNHLKVRTFLEFGLGFSTKYFLDSCEKVISVEFVTPGSGPDWIKKCLDLYRNYSNWIPITFFSGQVWDISWAPYKYLGSECVDKAACYQCSTHKNYALIDGFYLTELDAFISQLVQNHPIDIAFVDPGFYLRGDLVQLLFDKVPVIVAHDAAVRAQGEKNDVYGYSRIITPENYEEIYISYGQGTMVWILKNEKNNDLMDAIKNYAKRVEEEHL